MKCEIAMKQQEVKMQMELDRLKLEAQISATAAEEGVLAEMADVTPNKGIHRSSVTQLKDPAATYSQGMPHGLQGQPRSSLASPGVAPIKSNFPSTVHFDMPQGHERSLLNPLAMEWNPPMPKSSPETELLTAVTQQQQQILTLANLPKTSLMQFDGDPLQYNMFINAFDSLVDDKLVSDSTKLNLLIEHCSGKAARLIQCCTLMAPSEGYAQARHLLAERFGDNYIISEAWIAKICEGPVLKNTGSDMQEFADTVRCCMETLKAMNLLSSIDSRVRMVHIVNRLPYQVQVRWRKQAVSTKEKFGSYPSMDAFVGFLNTIAHELNDPVFGEQPHQKQHKQQKQPRHKSFHTSAVQSPAEQHTALKQPVVQSLATKPKASPEPEVNRACPFCKDDHYLAACPGFGNLDAQSRLDFVKESKVCFNCLKVGRHRARYCRFRNSCSTCTKKHNSLLHEALSNQVPKAVCVKLEKTEDDPEVSLACGTDNRGAEKIALPVVAVKVRAPDKATLGVQYVQTYALLDPGSNKTFCSMELLKKLDLKGKAHSLSLSTLNETRDSPVQIVELEVTGTRSKRVIHLPRVYALEAFPSLLSSIAEPDEIKQWDHLRGIPVPDNKKSEVMLLIGQDVPQAMIPLEVRHGHDYEP